jgi:hypothetical protein
VVALTADSGSPSGGPARSWASTVPPSAWPPVVGDDEVVLRAWLRDFSTRWPRWGWRRAATGARQASWKVNNKRIQRLWREEGLRVP